MSSFFISIGPSMTDKCTILPVKEQRLRKTCWQSSLTHMIMRRCHCPNGRWWEPPSGVYLKTPAVIQLHCAILKYFFCPPFSSESKLFYISHSWSLWNQGTYLTLTGCIVHGIGVYFFLADEGMAGGSNWTIECVSQWNYWNSGLSTSWTKGNQGFQRVIQGFPSSAESPHMLRWWSRLTTPGGSGDHSIKSCHGSCLEN